MSLIYRESEVPDYKLPDWPGAPESLQSPEKWESLGRPRLLQLFQDHVYGDLPDLSVKLKVAVREEEEVEIDGEKAMRVQVRIAPDERWAPWDGMDLLIYYPREVKGPIPVLSGLNFYGNQAVHTEKGIWPTRAWLREGRPATGIVAHRVTEFSRGISHEVWQIRRLLKRGFALATVCYGDLDPDWADMEFRDGVHAWLPNPRNPGSGGCISAWAWGLIQMRRFLADDGRFDPKRIAVMGHSRLGKTALWAGAVDRDFSVVISNGSGCGGSSLVRRRFGERVEVLNRLRPYWFAPRYCDYGDREDFMPVDMHQLVGLIAPRHVYFGNADNDLSADPWGALETLRAARPVYQTYGMPVFPDDATAELHKPIRTTLGYHIRAGKHEVNGYDMENYIQYLEQVWNYQR